MLLPAGLQLERARSLLADPGDIGTDDIKEFILLSSAREKAERKRLQRITTRAVAAVAAVVLIAGSVVGYLQWDKAIQLATQQERLSASGRQLATKEEALAQSGRQLGQARAIVAEEQAGNAALRDSLNKRQLDLDHVAANLRGELSGVSLLLGKFDSALRLASSGTRIDIDLGVSPTGPIKASPAAAALAGAVSEANWRFALRHEGAVNSAAFSLDGSRIVTTSEDKTARIWDAATGKELAVLRGHEGQVNSAAFSPDGSRIVTTSTDATARIWDAATWGGG
jgi:hypothetical protein